MTEESNSIYCALELYLKIECPPQEDYFDSSIQYVIKFNFQFMLNEMRPKFHDIFCPLYFIYYQNSYILSSTQTLRLG